MALEQVLHGADLGVVDPLTRQYVTWVWSYGRAPLDSGEALALCLATGAPFDELTREHSIAAAAREKSKKVVKLRTISQRAREDEDLGQGTAARPAPLIDELQRAAWLWSQNQSAQRPPTGARWANRAGRRSSPSARPSPSASPTATRTAASILGLLGATVRGRESKPAEGAQGPARGR